MNKFDDINRDHVIAAIQECVRTGEREFLRKYGFGKAKRYVLLDENFKKKGALVPRRSLVLPGITLALN